jgi:hypothetical protein
VFQVGDIVGFHSTVAGKHKYHLCVHDGGRFLFLNTPKGRAGEWVTDCVNVPGIQPTDSGKSAVSITVLMTLTDAELSSLGAQKLGKMPIPALRELLVAVENSPIITPEERDQILDGLGDYL